MDRYDERKERLYARVESDFQFLYSGWDDLIDSGKVEAEELRQAIGHTTSWDVANDWYDTLTGRP